MNENEILMKRLCELSHRAYERGYKAFSEFLSLNEISDMERLSPCIDATLFGGYDNAERCIAGFGEGIETSDFPIACIKIEPVQQKFADKLTHRDFLGSLMNLGINRNTIGDIIVKDNTCYLFCLDSISEYIINSTSRVKHTTVKCERAYDLPELLTELPDEEEIIVSSLRADAVVASIYKLSRNQASMLFRQEKIFINSRAVQKEATMLKSGDIISVRGFGKFIYENEIRKTKKDRMVISVRIYK